MNRVALGVSLALACASVPAASAHAARPRDTNSVKPLVHQLLGLINTDRATAGLPPYHLGRALTKVALAHSVDMARNHYFAHITPGGLTPFARMSEAHVTYRVAGENLGYAAGYSTSTSLQVIEMLMMQSPHHRANLLSTSFGHIGIGIVLDANAVYVTEDFTN